MKQYGFQMFVVVMILTHSGCMSPQGRQDNTASGTLAGGATGAIIGSMARHPGPGAIFGRSITSALQTLSI